MPSVQAIEVRCPECGARLPVSGDATTARCGYCGTESRIQRRTQVLQLARPLPPAQPHEPAHVAREVRSTGRWVAFGFVMVISLAIVISYTVRDLMPAATGVHGPSWQGGVPVIADVDGDGVDDFIGFDRNLQPDTMKLAAFSGKDGHVVWETPSLGTYTDVFQDGRMFASGAVLVWDSLAHVQAFDGKTGAARWKIDAPEVVKAGCVDGDRVVLATADKKRWSVSLVDGTLVPATGGCEPFADTFARCTGATDRDYHVTVDAMNVEDVYERGAGPRIALGMRYPGTPVPVIAGLDAKGATLWKTEVPGHDPLRAARMSPEHSAMSDHDVAVVYELQPKTLPQLAVFDRMTGARKFEVAAEHTMMNVVASVALSRSAVALSMWGCLQVFDLATGKRLFAIGS